MVHDMIAGNIDVYLARDCLGLAACSCERWCVMRRLHPVDWNDSSHPLAQSEPRRGQRAVLAATVLTPQGPLLCYCLHMEVRSPCSDWEMPKLFTHSLFCQNRDMTILSEAYR